MNRKIFLASAMLTFIVVLFALPTVEAKDFTIFNQLKQTENYLREYVP